MRRVSQGATARPELAADLRATARRRAFAPSRIEVLTGVPVATAVRKSAETDAYVSATSTATLTTRSGAPPCLREMAPPSQSQ